MSISEALALIKTQFTTANTIAQSLNTDSKQLRQSVFYVIGVLEMLEGAVDHVAAGNITLNQMYATSELDTLNKLIEYTRSIDINDSNGATQVQDLIAACIKARDLIDWILNAQLVNKRTTFINKVEEGFNWSNYNIRDRVSSFFFEQRVIVKCSDPLFTVGQMEQFLTILNVDDAITKYTDLVNAIITANSAATDADNLYKAHGKILGFISPAMEAIGMGAIEKNNHELVFQPTLEPKSKTGGSLSTPTIEGMFKLYDRFCGTANEFTDDKTNTWLTTAIGIITSLNDAYVNGGPFVSLLVSIATWLRQSIVAVMATVTEYQQHLDRETV